MSSLESAPGGVEVVVLGADEAGALDRVLPDVFDDAIDFARAREFLADPRHHLIVARAEGEVVGFVSAVHYVHPDKPRPELWINEVGVAPTFARRGIGKAMLAAVRELGRRLGCAEAWVLTERSNTAAMRLYAAAGGVTAPEDAVMFTFHLDEEG